MRLEAADRLCALDRDVLKGRGVGKVRDQPEPRLSDPRSDAIDKAELPDRRVNHPLGDDLLHLVEDRRTLLVVEFGGLLLVEGVDVGVAAIDIGATFDDKSLQARRGITEGPAAAED